MELFKKILLLISIIVTFIVFNVVINPHNNDFIYLPLIPLFYGILYKCLVPSNVIWGPGFFIMNLILFIRYILYPYLIVKDSFDFNLDIDPLYITPSIIIILMEMVVILIIFHYKCDKRFDTDDDDISDELDVGMGTISFDFIILIVIISLLLLCYVLEPNLYANKHFILNPALILEDKVEASGQFVIISRWFEKCIILVFLTILIKKGYSFYWCFILLLIPSLFFEGHSRLSILSPTAASLFLIYKIFPKKKKSIFGFGFILLFFSMSSLTMSKMYKVNEVNQLEITNPSSTVGAYFGGIPNIAKHLEMCDRFGDNIGLNTMVNDMFRNCIGISSLFSSKNNSVYHFNRTFYNLDVEKGDQIPTTVGQSISYFGILFFWVLTFIMVSLTLWADKKYRVEQRLEFAWLYAIFAVTVGWALPGSFQHLYMCLYYTFMPLFFIFKLYRNN